MLVLTRKSGEAVVLETDGKEIVVRLLEISGSRVRLGVEAPREVTVLREEIAPQASLRTSLRPKTPRRRTATTKRNPSACGNEDSP